MSIPEIKNHWRQHWKNEPKFLPTNPVNDSISTLLKTLITNLPSSHITFLDVGSGAGSRTIPILGQRNGAQIILLDQSMEALNLGQEHGYKENVAINSVAADGFRLPLRNGSLDCVFANGVNEHFLDPDRHNLIEEMIRVVKPGGHMAVIVPNKFNIFHTVNKVIQERKGTWPHGPQYDFSPTELLKRMRKTSLTDIKLFGVGAFTSWIRMFPRDQQNQYYQSPTPSEMLNKLLWTLDLDTSLGVNKMFGREILVMGRSPLRNKF